MVTLLKRLLFSHPSGLLYQLRRPAKLLCNASPKIRALRGTFVLLRLYFRISFDRNRNLPNTKEPLEKPLAGHQLVQERCVDSEGLSKGYSP